jgi:hypothetical protein
MITWAGAAPPDIAGEHTQTLACFTVFTAALATG